MKVVINNFFNGVLKRGIPIYTEELTNKLRENHIDVIELKCPKKLVQSPAWFLNILFIIYEQVITPLCGFILRSKYNIYPYNSVSILDLFTGKAIVIIHDFISLKSSKKNLAALYVKLCILVSSRRSRKVVYISKSTERVANKLGLFRNAVPIILPNTFYSFEYASKKTIVGDDDYILLVSGLGENKDLNTALSYYFKLDISQRKKLKILGCGNGIDKVKSLIKHRDEIQPIDVIGFVELDDVANLYSKASVIWAHSLAEGYGRTLAEAKISRKNILCTRISSFREQADENVYFYSDVEEFIAKYNYIIEKKPHVFDKKLAEHILFEQEMRRIYE